MEHAPITLSWGPLVRVICAADGEPWPCPASGEEHYDAAATTGPGEDAPAPGAADEAAAGLDTPADPGSDPGTEPGPAQS